MTDDIAGLIEQIKKADVEGFAWLLGLEFTHDEEAQEAKDTIVSALSRLSAHEPKGCPTPGACSCPPPPEEIAGLIKEFEQRAINLGKNIEVDHEDLHEWKAAAALRAQAQENERLAEIARVMKERYRQFDDENGQLQERIRELEGERDKWGSTVAGSEVEAAIRRKTIEECAQAAEWFNNVVQYTYADIAKRIRALAQTDGKTET